MNLNKMLVEILGPSNLFKKAAHHDIEKFYESHAGGFTVKDVDELEKELLLLHSFEGYEKETEYIKEECEKIRHNATLKEESK